MAEENFIDVEVTTNAQTLADNAVDSLQNKWEDWEPNEGNLEVVMIETLAPMAADAAETASRAIPAIFRNYGTKLIGLPYSAGAPARGTVTFTLINDEGGVIPRGTEIDIDGFAFETDADVIADIGVDELAAVPVSAIDDGIDANGLTGTAVTMLTALTLVDSVALDAPTEDGVDEEDDPAYQDRLARELLLQAKTLVTTRDFELMALNHAGVGRAIAQNDGERRVLVVATDLEGEALNSGVKEELLDVYEEFRQVNTVVTIDDPTYSEIDVTYVVKSYPGYEAADLISRIDSALSDYLNPLAYGRPRFGGDASLDVTTWLNQPVIYQNKIIDVISDVEGVDYVVSLTLASGTGTLDGAGNLTMDGDVPLPTTGTLAGSVA